MIYSIFVPAAWATGEPEEPHSPEIQRVINFRKPDVFIDYGQQIMLETGDEGAEEEYGELCFAVADPEPNVPLNQLHPSRSS